MPWPVCLSLYTAHHPLAAVHPASSPGLSVCHCTSRTIHWPFCLSLSFLSLYIRLSVFVGLSASAFLCALSVCPSFCFWLSLPVCLPLSVSVFLSVCVCLPISLFPVFICPPVRLSQSMSSLSVCPCLLEHFFVSVCLYLPISDPLCQCLDCLSVCLYLSVASLF